MVDVPTILIAAGVGFGSGFLVSIPVGPVNLGIMNEGAQRGFRQGVLVGVGATLMEVIYCSLAFTGFSNFFRHKTIKEAMEIFSFCFIMFLGVRFLMASSVPQSGNMEKSLQKKFHPHSAFMNGFVMVLGNPGVLLFWIIMSGSFVFHEWVPWTLQGKSSCVVGVALGTNSWFTGLAYAASLGHKKFSEKTLIRIERWSGISLLILGLAHGAYVAWKIAHHRF